MRIAYFMDTPKGVDSFVVNRNYPIDGERAAPYFDWQRRFLMALEPRARSLLRVRYSATDFGHGVVEKWKQWAPESIEDRTGFRCQRWWTPWITGNSGHRAMQRADLVICDYPNTSFLEAMGMNTPVICFFDPKVWPMRQAAHEALNVLRTYNIVQDTPEEAAEFLTVIHEEIALWWKGCQTSRFIFANQYCRGWNRQHRAHQVARIRKELPAWVRITTQHGGGYGMFATLPEEDHAIAHHDLFLCWGWANSQEYRGECRLMNLPEIA